MRDRMKSKTKIGLLLFEEQPKVTEVMGLQTAKGTFDFPLIGEAVKGSSGRKLVLEGDLSTRQEFIRAAKQLEQQGVKAISGQCGFMCVFQKDIAASVSVPVLTSSLLMVPSIFRMLPENKRVGIITINSKTLGEVYFNGAGWSCRDFPVLLAGVEEIESWKIYRNEKWDYRQMGTDLVALGRRFTQQNPDMGAIVLECTLMPPFTHGLQEATGLPVFDIVTFTKMLFEGITRKLNLSV